MRYLEGECHNCGCQVLVPTRERPGDVAIDKLNRLEKLLSHTRPVSGPAAVRLLTQAYRIIKGWA